MIVDNPAARLLAILKAGKTKDVRLPSRQVWYELLQVEPGNHALLAERLAKLMALPAIIATEMQEHHADENQTVSYWRGRVDSAFVNININAPWAEFINQIDDHSLNYLSVTAKLLQHATKLKPFGQAHLGELRGTLNELLKEVIEAEIDAEVKLSITRYLGRLINSIDEYFITGVLPILDAANATFGNVVVDPKYKEFLTNEPLGKKLVSAVSTVANAVTVVTGLPQLGQMLGLLISNAM
ncbi:hypothetical protein SAMN05192563_10655 [Paraburkholderia aspalathi]|uniref:Uncharacterized protein n=2 Tax=Paraburkholderia aspalathi TaxID=1324617 RepID=A0A1I7ERZ3_9BURK|nr:hypothetical protein SAMN05192563_10655 [Paraburkholderia aspalathi]